MHHGFATMSHESLKLVVEFTRKEHADNPYAFEEIEPQEYHVRDGDGLLTVAQFPWDETTIDDLAALHTTPPSVEARQRLGHRLAVFLERTCWSRMESTAVNAEKRGLNVFLTIRSSAAEIYSLPFELVALRDSDQPLGRLPNLCIRYEWPGTQTQPEHPNPRQDGGRILLAHSSAGGLAVPALEHQQAIADSMASAGLEFDPQRDVIGGVTLSSLARALESNPAQAPITVLHLLVHGSEGELVFSPDDVNSPIGRVDAQSLANILQEHASSLRLVVLAACQSGDSKKPDSHIVGVAQALHRAGIESVVAARFPLSIQGSIQFAKAFYHALLEGPSSVEAAFVAAREVLEKNAHTTLDWACLQLYRRFADGTDARPIVFRPYRGLLAFEEHHHKFFYGREAEKANLKVRLEEAIIHTRPPFQMVIGAAGTGKSSLVMSGVSTELKRMGWNVVKLRPAERRGALPALFHALRKTRQAIRAETAGIEEILPHSSGEALSRESKRFSYDARGRKWLLVIDQFEEIFTLESSNEERRLFVETLLELSRTPELSVVVLCIMRVDYLARIGEVIVRDGPLRYSLDRIAYDADHTFTLTQMPQERLTDVMVKPATRVGMGFEHGLPERIIAEAGDEAAALPLLAYVLDELWLHRRGQVFTVDAYQQLNGFRGALGRAADAVFHSLDAVQKRHAKRFLEAMVSPGDGNRADARARAWTDTLRPPDPEREAFQSALAQFARSRLIVVGDELSDDPNAGAWAELAHDSLLHQWHTLHGWINEDRETLAEVAALRTKALAYLAEPGIAEYLLYGKQLAQALALRDEKHELLDQECLKLINASEAAELRRKQREEEEAARLVAAKEAAEARDRQEARRHLALAIAVITVLSAVSIVAILNYRRSRDFAKRLVEVNATVIEQKELAEQSSKRARMTALLAIAERLVDSDPTRAVAFLREIENPDALHGFEETALRALEHPIAEMVFEGHHGSIRALAFVENDQRLLAAGANGVIFAVPLDNDNEQYITRHEIGSNIVAMSVISDGTHVISAGDDKDVRIASLQRSGEDIALAHTSPLRAFAVHPKDGTIATASDSALRIFQRSSASKLPIVLGTPGDTTRHWTTVAFRPDGQELVAGGSDGKVGFFSLGKNYEARFDTTISGHIISLEYNSTGSHLLIMSDADPEDQNDQGPVHLVRVDAKPQHKPLAGGLHAHWAKFSPTGTHIALRTTDGTVRILGASGEGDSAIIWQDSPISWADWSSDGQTILGVDQQDIVHVRRIGAKEDDFQIPAACSVSRVAMSADGSRLAFGCRAGEIRIFRRKSPILAKEPITTPKHAFQVVSAAWSASGERAAALLEDKGAKTLYVRDSTPSAIFVEAAQIAEGRELILSPDGMHAAIMQRNQGVLVIPLQQALEASRTRNAAPKIVPTRIVDATLQKVVMNPQGTHLASASNEGSVCIFGIDQTSPSRCFLHKGAVLDLAWLPNGKELVTAAADGRVRWISIDHDAPLGEFRHNEPVVALLPHNNGEQIVTLTERKNARVWHVRTGKPKAVHSEQDGKFVLAAASSKHVLLVHNTGAALFDWALEDEKPLQLEGGMVDQAAFSLDGSFVATLARDGAVRVFRTDSGVLVATLDENASPIRWLSWRESPESILLTTSIDGIVQARPLHIADIQNRLWRATAYCPSAHVRRNVFTSELSEAQDAAGQCKQHVLDYRAIK